MKKKREVVLTPLADGAGPVLLSIKEVTVRTSLSRSTILRLIARGAFPTPVRLSAQRVAFPADAIIAWIGAQRPMHQVTAGAAP